ncbi:small acidic protein family-domain-containing protein [Phycomyces nitens]|nr:small acidic protein family-domain-containing protein [Phycomyces nitens]
MGKSEKIIKSDISPATVRSGETEKHKKSKKEKKNKDKDSSNKRKRSADEESEEEKAVVETKKAKKEKKDKKEKKSKKSKKDKKESDTSDSDDTKKDRDHSCKATTSVPKVEEKKEEPATTTGWNDWSKASFGGDQEQKSKFMRLLGANKTANKETAAAPKKKGGLFGSLKSAIDEDENQRIANDLEKQFKGGLQMRKQQYTGQRGGLGFSR